MRRQISHGIIEAVLEGMEALLHIACIGRNSEFPVIKGSTGIKPAAIASATEIPNGSPATTHGISQVFT